MSGPRVLSVDLGAASVRVASVDLGDRPRVEILHRWHHSPIRHADGSLRWDWPGIVKHVEVGLEAGLNDGDVASIGIDGWGVDYGLIDEHSVLIDLPFAYRDERTSHWEEVASRIGAERLYEATGIQLMGINTIFQLAADPPERIEAARTMLLLPDLLVNHLTGWVGCEVSNMSTTGLMDARTATWDDELIDAIGAPRDLFPEPATAGLHAGSWRDTPVHLVGSHDTASAFLGVPFDSEEPTVFVSAGSWVLVGIERSHPDTSALARALNFSNEAGALGGIRFLRNVVGFWLLEECRSAWGDPPIEVLVDEASAVSAEVPIFDAGDHRFVGSGDVLAEVLSAADLPTSTPRPIVVRSILESIVAGVSSVVDDLEAVTHRRPQQAVLVGGAARIPLVGRLLHERANLLVTVGSAEATALGNAVVQGVAVGRFEGAAEGREWLRSTPTTMVDER